MPSPNKIDTLREPPLVAGRGRARFRSVADGPDAAGGVPAVPHAGQQHRRAERRSVPAAGNWRRSFPIERGVPDADASEGRRRGRTSRPASRSIRSTRSGSGRTRRSPRCSCASRTSIRRAAAIRLFVRLHRLDQLGIVRETSRCRLIRESAHLSSIQPFGQRRDAGRARRPPAGGQKSTSSTRWWEAVGRMKSAARTRATARGWPTTSTMCARSSGGSRRSSSSTRAATHAAAAGGAGRRARFVR